MNKVELFKLREDVARELKHYVQIHDLDFSVVVADLLARCQDVVTAHINCIEHIERQGGKEHGCYERKSICGPQCS